MSRREFTNLGASEIADEIISMIAAAIKRDRRFPTLQAMELDLLFADTRKEIETGPGRIRVRHHRGFNQ